MAVATNVETSNNTMVLAGGVFGVQVQSFLDANAPAYAPGMIYFSLTDNKLKIGGASGYETVTSS